MPRETHLPAMLASGPCVAWLEEPGRAGWYILSFDDVTGDVATKAGPFAKELADRLARDREAYAR